MKGKHNLTESMTRQLLRIINKYRRMEELPIRINNDLEISTREIHTIQVIGENCNIRVKGIADLFGVTKSAASQMVSKLEKRGFITKNPAPDNDKELNLSLTKLGQQAFQIHDNLHGKDKKQLINKLKVFTAKQIATTSVFLDFIEDVIDNRLSQNKEE